MYLAIALLLHVCSKNSSENNEEYCVVNSQVLGKFKLSNLNHNIHTDTRFKNFRN